MELTLQVHQMNNQELLEQDHNFMNLKLEGAAAELVEITVMALEQQIEIYLMAQLVALVVVFTIVVQITLKNNKVLMEVLVINLTITLEGAEVLEQ